MLTWCNGRMARVVSALLFMAGTSVASAQNTSTTFRRSLMCTTTPWQPTMAPPWARCAQTLPNLRRPDPKPTRAAIWLGAGGVQSKTLSRGEVST